MRFMTYNIQIASSHGHNPDWKLDLFNLPGVAEVIAGQSPDVVALQEVDRGRARSGFVDQARRLGEALGYHEAFACAYSEPQAGGGYGNALLSRYPIAAFESHPLWHRDAPAPGEPRWVTEPRCCFVATLHAERPIRVMGLHLSTTADQRRRQLEQVAGLVEADGETPTVLMGDFNAPHPELQATRLPGLLQNILAPAPAPTWPNGIPAKVCIDHIWVSSEWAVKAAWVVSERLGVSDHNPVVADLALPAARPGSL